MSDGAELFDGAELLKALAPCDPQSERLNRDYARAAKVAFDQVILVALENNYEPSRASKEMTEVWNKLQSAFHAMRELKNG